MWAELGVGEKLELDFGMNGVHYTVSEMTRNREEEESNTIGEGDQEWVVLD